MLHSFNHQGLKLSYYDSGGDGPVLIFQHGLTGDHQQTRQSFLSDDYRLITLECRGHGLSDVGNSDQLGIITFADDLLALLDHLKIERAFFAGISMGAAVTARFTALHPERVKSLTLVRPAWSDSAAPTNLMIFSIAADFLALYGDQQGRERFVNSDAFKALQLESEDNAQSLEKLFVHPQPHLPALLRNIVICDPGWCAADINNAHIRMKVIGTSLDYIHPLSMAGKVASGLGLKGFVDIFPKTLDKEKHLSELTSEIIANAK